MIVEGVNVLQTPSRRGRAEASVVVSDFFDFSIYVDAAEADLERWYVDRLLLLRETSLHDPRSYFNFLTQYTEDATREFARVGVDPGQPREPAREHRADARPCAPRARKGPRPRDPARAAAQALARVAVGASVSVRTPRNPNHASSEIHCASWSPSTTASGSRSARRPTDSAMPTIAFASICRCSSGAGISISVAIVSAAASRISSTMRANSGIGAQRRAEQEQERRPVADREPEVRAEAELDPIAQRARVRGRLGERAEQLAAGLLEQLDVQRALAREVLVEDGLGDARGFRDLVHRRRVEALLREPLARDLEELLTALIGRHPQGRPGRASPGSDTRLQRHHVAVDVIEVPGPELVELRRLRRR